MEFFIKIVANFINFVNHFINIMNIISFTNFNYYFIDNFFKNLIKNYAINSFSYFIKNFINFDNYY